MTSTYDPAEHPKDAKGQWATKVHAEADGVELGAMEPEPDEFPEAQRGWREIGVDDIEVMVDLEEARATPETIVAYRNACGIEDRSRDRDLSRLAQNVSENGVKAYQKAGFADPAAMADLYDRGFTPSKIDECRRAGLGPELIATTQANNVPTASAMAACRKLGFTEPGAAFRAAQLGLDSRNAAQIAWARTSGVTDPDTIDRMSDIAFGSKYATHSDPAGIVPTRRERTQAANEVAQLGPDGVRHLAEALPDMYAPSIRSQVISGVTSSAAIARFNAAGYLRNDAGAKELRDCGWSDSDAVHALERHRDTPGLGQSSTRELAAMARSGVSLDQIDDAKRARYANHFEAVDPKRTMTVRDRIDACAKIGAAVATTPVGGSAYDASRRAHRALAAGASVEQAARLTMAWNADSDERDIDVERRVSRTCRALELGADDATLDRIAGL